MKERLYDIFMDLIGKLSNEEIKTLIDSLEEYVENDKLFESEEE